MQLIFIETIYLITGTFLGPQKRGLFLKAFTSPGTAKLLHILIIIIIIIFIISGGVCSVCMQFAICIFGRIVLVCEPALHFFHPKW